MVDICHFALGATNVKMAGESQAHTEFFQILSGLNRKFEIIHAKWSEDKLFEVKFRTQIQRNCEDFNTLCDEWVDLFSESTNTVWAKKISNTGPKIRFRKQYQCWTQGGKVVQKELLFDARRCRATLDIKVLTDNPQTRRKNKHIKMGLNVVVKVSLQIGSIDINEYLLIITEYFLIIIIDLSTDQLHTFTPSEQIRPVRIFRTQLRAIARTAKANHSPERQPPQIGSRNGPERPKGDKSRQ